MLFFSSKNIFFATAVVFLLPGLHGILAGGVPVYSVLLMTMVWRATSRVQFFEASTVVYSGGSAMTVYKLGYWRKVRIFFFTAQANQLWAQLTSYVSSRYSS